MLCIYLYMYIILYIHIGRHVYIYIYTHTPIAVHLNGQHAPKFGIKRKCIPFFMGSAGCSLLK